LPAEADVAAVQAVEPAGLKVVMRQTHPRAADAAYESIAQDFANLQRNWRSEVNSLRSACWQRADILEAWKVVFDMQDGTVSERWLADLGGWHARMNKLAPNLDDRAKATLLPAARSAANKQLNEYCKNELKLNDAPRPDGKVKLDGH